jgi:hypothetical protein
VKPAEPASMPWPNQKRFLPAEPAVTSDWPAPHWTPNRFQGAQDPSMRLQTAPEVPEVPEVKPGDVIEAGETRRLPAIDDTNPGFLHTGTVWAPDGAIDDSFERLDAAWGAPGPVQTPLSLQEGE